MDPITLDPAVTGPASWSELGSLLISLWRAVLFIVLFASNMILGHIMIPSFVMSGHIPDSFRKARPVLYVLAIICFALAAFFIFRASGFAMSVLDSIWPDYWI